MNFCSIEDAWGDNKISNQFQKYNSNNNDKNCINPTKVECSIKENKPIEHFKQINNIEIINCDTILNHINQCNHCYNKLHQQFNMPQKNELINNLHNIINNNKDTVVLILIGIFIIMFFKLVNNITSK
jgi:uncharacterized membrane protein YraQ (UPF0718 family)